MNEWNRSRAQNTNIWPNMSLVNYASSSDDDDQPSSPKQFFNKVQPDIPPKRQRFVGPKNESSNSHNNRNLAAPSNRKMEVDSYQSSELKLPDASLLFDSPTVLPNPLNASSHLSRVAAAMAESERRKRDLNPPNSSYPRNKVPKGNMPHSRRVPDTVDGRLLPPQLAGRSNVVTEDITKLFVRKPTNSSA